MSMKTMKKGNNWTAYYDPDNERYFAEIIYTSREGREQYNYEISRDIYSRLGSFGDDSDNEELIRTAIRRRCSAKREEDDVILQLSIPSPSGILLY